MKQQLRSCALALALGAFSAIAQASGTLTVCTESAPDGFDIAQSQSSVTHSAVGKTIYDQLLSYKRGTTELVPGLAERWEISADGLQYTLHLRRGVKFHRTPWFTPTRDMNADDVVFSIRRFSDPPWQAAAKNGFGMWIGAGLAEEVKAIDKLDDLTVRFTLRRPRAPFLGSLAWSFTSSVFSAEYAAKLLKAGRPEQLDVLPVGTGPFMLRNYQKDAVIRYDANPEYWGGAPKIDRLVFAITPDANVRVQRLKAGECLIGSNMRGETIGAFDGTPVHVLGDTPLLTSYIAINTQHKSLADIRLRQALALAFDRETYIRSVYGGRALAASSFLPPVQWGYDASLAMKHDPEEAKKLVKASGYDGSEFTIFTRIGGSIDGKRAAELMQADWARIGVKTRIQMMEWGELLKRTGQGEHDITFFGWVGAGDPDEFFNINLTCAGIAGGGNGSMWCNKDFDALLEQARATSDRSQRVELYRKAQRWVFDEVPLIPTVYPRVFTALHESVRGFIGSPFADLDFRNVSVLESPK